MTALYIFVVLFFAYNGVDTQRKMNFTHIEISAECFLIRSQRKPDPNSNFGQAEYFSSAML